MKAISETEFETLPLSTQIEKIMDGVHIHEGKHILEGAKAYVECVKFLHALTKRGCSIISEDCIPCDAVGLLRKLGERE